MHAVACRNPLTGLCGLQLPARMYERAVHEMESQSPYGAMWFATRLLKPPLGPGLRPRRRNPLTGLCGLQQNSFGGRPAPGPAAVAIPLRGYVVCNKDVRAMAYFFGRYRRNPLTGLCGLQPERLGGNLRNLTNLVAIPLRGYVVCNQSGATWSWGSACGCRNPLTGLCGLQLR